MTLAEALALADQDSPLPSLAGRALKLLRVHINRLERDSTLSLVALGKLQYLLERGARQFGVAVTTDWDRRIAVLSNAGKVLWFNPREASETDSATLTALIAELRAREALGRKKYGTDVDRTDLTASQWRQHLREELMDALLYSLAEERTQAPEDC